MRAAQMMNIKLGDLPIKYLGMTISNKAMRIEDFEPVIEKVAGRVEPWQGWLMASAGRLFLVNDCLTNIPMFTMGYYVLQDGVHEKSDQVRSIFFWEKVDWKQKYHRVYWQTICSPKENGGLGS